MALKKLQIIDAHLTEIAQGYAVGNVIYDKVAPLVVTPKIAGKFIKWDKNSFRVLSSRRAMGAKTKESNHDFELGSYTLPDGYSRKVTVDDRADKQTAGISNLNLLAQKIQIERRQMEMEKEIEIANIVTNVANFTYHGNVSGAGAGGWANNDQDIFGDVENRKGTVCDATGEYPNKLMITRDVWAAMRKNTGLQSFFNTNPLASKSGLQPKMLADLFELDEIIIAKSSYINQAGTRVNVWGSGKAVLFYSAPSAGKTPMDPSDLPPSAFWTLQLDQNPFARKGYNEEDGIEWAVVEDNWLGLQTSSEAAYFFESVLT